MYIFAIILLSSFAFIEVFNKEITDKYKIIFAFICFAFLVFQDGFRWETGTDWTVYKEYFERLTLDYDWNTGSSKDFDIGYVLFNYVIRIFTDNYSIVLIIYAFIFYSVFIYFIFKISSSPFVSLLIFYMITVFYMGMNRQFIAMEFYVLSLIFLLKDKKKEFLLLIIIGAFFHKTILLGLVAPFLNRKISNTILITVFCIIMLIAISNIINKLPLGIFSVLGEQAGNKMEYYSYEHDSTSILNTILALTRRAIWIVPLMVFDKTISEKREGYYLFFNLFYLGSLFYILFNGTILQILVGRALLYYNLMEMLLIPYVLAIIKPNYGKMVIMFLVVLYVFININKGFKSYGEDTDYFLPYKSIFINTDYQRQSI